MSRRLKTATGGTAAVAGVEKSNGGADALATAAALAEVINKADDQQAVDEAKAAIFGAKHQPEARPLPDWFERTIETTWLRDEEIVPTTKKLRDELALFDSRAEHGQLMRSNDLAEHNRHLAFRVYLTAKLELDGWEKKNEVSFATLRSEANRTLQAEKERGFRNKSITDADVVAKMAEMFPDDWEAQESRRLRAKLTLDMLQDLFNAWESRCRTLNVMLTKSR